VSLTVKHTAFPKFIALRQTNEKPILLGLKQIADAFAKTETLAHPYPQLFVSYSTLLH
jgi:hypothetical protein